MTVAPILLPAAISTAIATALIATVLSARFAGHRQRLRTAGARLEPLLLQGERKGWSQAPVHGTPLVIRYQEAGCHPMEGVIHPKSILGERVQSRGVRPQLVNAYSESHGAMRAFRYSDIVWAADAHSGELIEDLYHYLGGAQSGGAPAPVYTQTGTPLPARPIKRHW